eukprot:2138443-Rhodomonas_salina.1
MQVALVQRRPRFGLGRDPIRVVSRGVAIPEHASRWHDFARGAHCAHPVTDNVTSNTFRFALRFTGRWRGHVLLVKGTSIRALRSALLVPDNILVHTCRALLAVAAVAPVPRGALKDAAIGFSEGSASSRGVGLVGVERQVVAGASAAAVGRSAARHHIKILVLRGVVA